MARNSFSAKTKISNSVQQHTARRILAYAEEHYAGKYTRIDVRFRGRYCYIDAYREPDIGFDYMPAGLTMSFEEYQEALRNTPTHLCRLGYIGNEFVWEFAFYTYSNEKYQKCFLSNGSFFGTPEEAFETAAVYLKY